MFLIWGIYDLFENGIVRILLTSIGPNEVGRAALLGVGFVLCVAVSYLLGSINWALIISRHLYHDDIRRYGSGNAGTTNILRTYGKKAAILTFLGDVLKGIVAILFACVIFGFPRNEYGYLYLITAAYMSAFFCVFGHIFPCFERFRGGKGFATMVGIILVLNPAIFLILLALYCPLILCSHYVSLSSVTIALFYPMLLAAFDRAYTHLGIHVLFALCIGFLVTWSHRSNLKRLMDGTERKIYLFKKKTKEDGDE